jgi:hypothetical protein
VLPGDGDLAFSRKGLHEPDTKRWQAPALNVTVRQVCASCNNGWMSRLETEAKPLLSPMIEGKAIGLSSREQVLAATWATKTAVMLSFTHGAQPVVPASHISELFGSGEPPASTHVWIAAYEGEWSGWYSGDVIGIGPPSKTEGLAYCATMVVGHLVFQVLGHDLAEPIEPLSAPEADRLSVQLWPPQSTLVSWPPRFAILDGWLDLFAGQFATHVA